MDQVGTEEIVAAVGALLLIARLVVKFTKTEKDDKIVQRIADSVKRFVG